jgi:hypothetical protein
VGAVEPALAVLKQLRASQPVLSTHRPSSGRTHPRLRCSTPSS